MLGSYTRELMRAQDRIEGERHAWKLAELEATPLRDNRWAVRPKGQRGTVGFSPFAWTVRYVRAATAEEAIRIAKR